MYCFFGKIKEVNYQPMIYGNLKSFMLMLDMKKIEQYTDKGVVDGIKEKVDLNIGF